MVLGKQFLTFVLGSFVASGVLANEPDYFSLSLEELLEQKIYSPTLTAENIKTVPASITVFTRADIRRMGIETLSELVNFVPGFQSFRNDDSSINYTLSNRGRRVGAGARELLVLWDGQRLNDEISGGTGQKDPVISLDNVERIEFIRGPGSAIYGSNAMTGIINIVTRSESEVKIAAGNHGQQDVSVQWRAQHEVGWLELHLQQRESEGEALSVFEPSPNPATPQTLDAHDPWRFRQIYLRAGRGDLTLSLRSAETRAEDFYITGFIPADSGYVERQSQFAAVDWRPDLSESIRLEGRVYLSDRDFIAKDIASSIAPNPVFTPVMLSSGVSDDREYGSQWILFGEQEKGNWLLGGEWRQAEVDAASSKLVRASDGVVLRDLPNGMEGKRIARSFFGQYQYPLQESLAVTLGARHDHYSDFGGHTSPRFALVKQLGKRDSVKLLYSEAYRAPSPSETRLTANIVAVSNPELEPETAKTTELVWVQLIDDGYWLVTLFDSWLEDAVVDTITEDQRRSWINSSFYINGVELEWQWNWAERWRSQIALTHIHHPGSETNRDSNNLLGASLSYQRGAFLGSLLLNYQGDKVDANEQDFPATIQTTEQTRLSSHSLWHLHLSYEIVKDWDLYLHVNNLLDKDYLNPAARRENYVGVPGEGRSFNLGVRWQY
jgi:outer membrane cobalamin receptor